MWLLTSSNDKQRSRETAVGVGVVYGPHIENNAKTTEVAVVPVVVGVAEFKSGINSAS